MTRTIVQTGHPALRTPAKEVPAHEIGSSHIRELIAEMKTLLSKEEYGVALAAPQVGESLRLFVVSGAAVRRRTEKSDDEAEKEIVADEVYINPVLLKVSRSKKDKHEGCLSVRGKWGVVPRADKASVKALNENGEEFTRGASGLLAHIFQHEMDHLDGVLYVDKATELYDDNPEKE